MSAYLLRRTSFALVLVFLSTIISFTILKLSPGASGQTDIDPNSSDEYIKEQNRQWGEDQPSVQQYLSWLGVEHLLKRAEPPGLLQGYLGKSRPFNDEVSHLIESRLPATLFLNIAALLFTWLVAIPLGTYAAVHQYKWPDSALSVLSFVGMSLPGFFLAILLLWLFAGRVHWLPPGGLRSIDHYSMSSWHSIGDYAWHLIVPVVVLTFGALAGLQRITRGNMLTVLRQQYVTTARAKGLSENRVIYKHALRNAINPLVTLLGFEFAGLFGGSALLENVINYPGMGQLLLLALQAKDRNLVMAIFLIGSVMLVLGNLFAEILLAWVDPRVSYA